MKNCVFWDVTPCGSCESRRFGGASASFIRVTIIGELGTTLAVTRNRPVAGITHAVTGGYKYGDLSQMRQ
jgi:hypothetical protein